METYNMANFSNDQWQEAMVSIANTGISTTPPTDVVSTTGSPITADQGVVSASFGAGVASWSVEATGTFSAGTTLFFEFQLTGSGNWYQAFGVPIGSTSDVAVSSVAGGAPITYQGNAAGFQAFRVRAHTLAGGDSVSVKIVGSLATDGGFVSKSFPPGTNKIGGVTIADGDLTTLGAQADASATTDSGTFSYMSLFKRLLAKFSVIGAQTTANSSAVNIASNKNVPIKNSFTEIAGQGTGVVNAINTDLIPSTDVSAYTF